MGKQHTEAGGLAVEAAMLFIVIVMLMGAAAVSLGAARLSQAIIQAHHQAKLAATGEWHTELVQPKPSAVPLDQHLKNIAALSQVEMRKQADPILDHGCGLDQGSTTIINLDDIGTGGDTFTWAETVADPLARDYTQWVNFPVIGIETECSVTLKEFANVPLPGVWDWDISVTSYVPIDCYRSTVKQSTQLCG